MGAPIWGTVTDVLLTRRMQLRCGDQVQAEGPQEASPGAHRPRAGAGGMAGEGGTWEVVKSSMGGGGLDQTRGGERSHGKHLGFWTG